jgi:ABC-type polysaccharide/polyol phosphate transport system ATPase subunit
MTIAVALDRVSKFYRRGHAPSFREDTVRIFQRFRGRHEPLPVVEALSDVSFEVERGGSFALMGANGSGKTTALKLISRVTYPTSGAVRVRGRIGALIEVGTGLHTELTGRENLWLYGRILGLKKNEIARAFDSIVDFADIGLAIDQPVKQYSSGMQLRLGFALVAHLEPDILLVDEAVSVGDAGFQRRCVQRMTELHKMGATLIFVSHVTPMVTALCSSGVLLRSGRVVAAGPIDDVVAGYLNEMADRDDEGHAAENLMTLRGWDYDVRPGRGTSIGDLAILLHLAVPTAMRNPRVEIAISHPRAGTLVVCSMLVDGYSVGTLEGDVTVRCDVADLPLQAGEYQVWATIRQEQGGLHVLSPRLLGDVVLGNPEAFTSRDLDFVGTATQSLVRAPYAWTVEPASEPQPHA